MLAVLSVGLVGCTTPQPGPTAAPAPPTSSPTASPQPEPSAGPLSEERAQFDAALAAVLEANPDPDGRSVVDALVAAGFDKAAMEVTPDSTALGLDADSIQFSVRIDESCIVGQSGNVGYHSVVLPVLATGRCLVGKTRTIDW